MQQAWTPRILWAPDKESEDKSFEFKTINVESHKAKVGFFNEFAIHSDSDSDFWVMAESSWDNSEHFFNLGQSKDLYQV